MADPGLPFIRRAAKRHPLPALLLCAVCVLASLAVISRARFDTDVTRLIPLHAEKTALYFEVLRKTGGMEKAYVVFSSDRLTEHLSVIDRVGREMLATGLVTRAEWKISDEAKVFLRDVYARKAPLLLGQAEFGEFLQRLTPGGMAAELGRSSRRLAVAGSPEQLAAADPLNLFELFQRHAATGQGSVDFRTGYYLAPDARQAVMILTPAGSPRDISFSGKFVAAAERVLDAGRTDGLTMTLTGTHAITFHEASVMKRELVMNILMSFASVAVFFLFFFRSLRGLLFVLIPTVAAMVITTGSVLLFTGALSEVSGGFSALIAGLGIDIGIVLYVRYLIDLQSRPDTVAAMDASIAMVHRGITTGVLTSAITFLPMLLSSFRGVRELGLLTGIALVVCWLLLFGLVPLIVRPAAGRVVRVRGVEAVTVFCHERPRLVFGSVLAATVFFCAFAPRVELVGDISRLGTRDNPARTALERMKGRFVKEADVFLKGSAPDLDAALEKSLELKRASAETLEGVTAAADFLAPRHVQERNLEAIRRLDADRIVRDFQRAAKNAGFLPEAFAPFLGRLRLMLANRDLLTIDDLGPLRSGMDRLLVREKDGWTVLVTGSLRRGASAAKLPASATGPQFVRQELLSILVRDTVLISIVGLLLVNAVLYLDFRNVYDTILCQAPVFLSILWTLGVMGMAGISLNFMNAFVFVMLFGIGTDYVVHLLHRYRRDGDVRGTFSQTGTAVLISGITTVAGVGSIGATSYQGLASMGQVTAIGTFFCVLLSLTLVPAMMRRGSRVPDRPGLG
ncbi:MAG: hypothetical protein OHK006_02920 [Thermodesulfovibrionales bacterium]